MLGNLNGDQLAIYSRTCYKVAALHGGHASHDGDDLDWWPGCGFFLLFVVSVLGPVMNLHQALDTLWLQCVRWLRSCVTAVWATQMLAHCKERPICKNCTINASWGPITRAML